MGEVCSEDLADLSQVAGGGQGCDADPVCAINSPCAPALQTSQPLKYAHTSGMSMLNSRKFFTRDTEKGSRKNVKTKNAEHIRYCVLKTGDEAFIKSRRRKKPINVMTIAVPANPKLMMKETQEFMAPIGLTKENPALVGSGKRSILFAKTAEGTRFSKSPARNLGTSIQGM
jgi:hypothetical protein